MSCLIPMTVTEVLQAASLVGIIAGACFATWQASLYRKLNGNEGQIRLKEDEIDAVEPDVNARTSGQPVNNDQRLAQIETRKAPLERQLERLKQERHFILDKIVFAKR